ncbi:MAG: hypothetical protein JO110_05030 [Acetobacteraceae bacterium]|nr:hypothetical protein [Acetobacteraceae bacterium]
MPHLSEKENDAHTSTIVAAAPGLAIERAEAGRLRRLLAEDGVLHRGEEPAPLRVRLRDLEALRSGSSTNADTPRRLA